ncbi:RNA polymerase sigma factor (sigma-70 family) [Diaminobutyricimonas aerilata]|uniref:RNA polymerase sigma factor (Sigma-70 family) n=1 Tax=Diaminobutyricimonas aerilata TaxID=1162967 RepID=A0A2M9CNL8_9MICO|nr:sigma-70 family RNA polymerase sigma factor [Diaminobutyricimonas aerilata]PJJ73487.1 RNA polymerase sigma factor (sigma-70 family) [Diaminobutyricimonas aerilata]
MDEYEDALDGAPIVGDDELADRSRAGDAQAFAELWSRHARAGLAAARQFQSIADPDDIVAEAYLNIFRAMQRGGGPTEAFRPYLYRTIRNVALSWARNSNNLPIDAAEDLPDPKADVESTVLENTVTVRAFRTLPERWQTVLWYTEVEGMEPAEAAPHLGLSANSVAALAYRAREGLRKAWLQAHVSDTRIPEECRWTTERMGEYARGGLTPRARQKFEKHLETCTRCSILLEEIDDISGRLAAILLPAVLGGTAGAGYLAHLLAQNGSGGAPAMADGSNGGSNDGGTGATTIGVGAGTAVGVGASGAAMAAAGGTLFRMSGRTVAVAAATALAVAAATVGAFAINGAFVPQPSQPTASSPDAPADTDADADTDGDTDAGDDPATVPPPAPPVTAPPVLDETPPPATPPRTRPGRPVPLPPLPGVPPLPPPVLNPVDTTAPAVPVVSGPVDGLVTNSATPTFSGTGEPGSTVTLSSVAADGTVVPLGTATVARDDSWSFTPAAPLAEGVQTVRLVATDTAGNRSQPVDRTITVDTVAPAAPVLAAVPTPTSDPTPTFSGTAEPLSTVQLVAGATVIGTAVADAAGAWALTPAAPLADGTFALSATAVDAAGNSSGAATSSVTVDTFAAPPVMSEIEGDAHYLPRVAGTAEGGATVVLVDGSGSPIGEAIADVNGAWTTQLDSSVRGESLTISARQTDAAGNVSSASTAANVPLLVPRFVAPADGSTSSTGTVSVEISGDRGLIVQILIDGVWTGRQHLIDGPTITRVTPELSPGPHTIAVRYFDPASGTHGAMSVVTVIVAE